MTGEQKAWLDAHRIEGYRPVGATPGGSQWVRRGWLHPNGSFDQTGERSAIQIGSFEVGILHHTPRPEMRGP